MLVDVRSTKDSYAEGKKFYGVVVKGLVFLWDETCALGAMMAQLNGLCIVAYFMV